MWFFVLIILTGAYLQTLIKLSVLKRRFRWGSVLLFTLPVFFFYSRAAEINLKDFNRLMNDPEFLNTISVLVIVQEALVLVFGTMLLRRYLLNKKIHFWYYGVLLPSGLFPLSAFLGMVYLFNSCSGIDFGETACWFSFGVFMFTGVVAELLRLSVNDMERLIQWGALASLVQIFVAMFLPVMLGDSPAECPLEFNLSMLMGTFIIVASAVLFAFLSYMEVGRKLFAPLKRLSGSYSYKNNF